jgi:hypothetical protein
METPEHDFLKMKYRAENPYAFFEYLKICKGGDGLKILSEVNTSGLWNIKGMDYYEIITFKTFMCELIFHAVNAFPDISEYTITCESPNGTTWITLSNFETPEDDEHPCMAKFKSIVTDMVHELSLKELKYIYMNNRYNNINHDVVNMFMTLMYTGGNNVPKITTSYKMNKPVNQLKFK